MDYATAWPRPHAAAIAAAPPQPELHHDRLHSNPYASLLPPSEYHLPHYAASAAPPHPSNPNDAAAASFYPNPAAAAPAAAGRDLYASYAPYAAYSYAPPASAAYYYGAGAAGAETAAAAAAGKEAVRQYGFDPQLYSQAVSARSSNGVAPPAPATVMQHTQWNSHFGYPPLRNTLKKRMKKTKVVQSAFCEVCKIDCTTPDVLKTHKQGKKHKKNLEKLQEAITAKPLRPPTTSVAENKAAPPSEIGKPKKKSAVATPEELEVKKRRVLEAGAAEGEVRICTVCNVVVNNQKVYDFHIAGQKHQTMLQKQQGRQGA